MAPAAETTVVRGEALADDAPPQASAELLRYGDLRMPPPSSRQRGRLVLSSRLELYLALFIEQKVEIGFDVGQAMALAVERAHSVPPPPPGCELAWADGFDYAYPSEVPVDVPSDASFHSIPLGQKSAASEPSYVVVPRQSADVFRIARLENPLGAPLLPGPVDVYLRGDFLLTSRMELTPPRGRFTIGLGVEQRIKVARNTRYREESAGLTRGALLLHHEIHIEVRNNLGRAALVEVRERIPVAREDDDDLEITVGKIKPAWEDWRQELAAPGQEELRGGKRWRVSVAPGGVEEIVAEYQIKMPAKLELVGGNRREA